MLSKDMQMKIPFTKCHANGNDFIIKVPTGTEILLEDKETLIKDLSKNGEELVIVFGGKGGLGNINFKGKAVTVVSVNGAGSTIIDCGGEERGITFDFGEDNTSVFDGFTIVNGARSEAISITVFCDVSHTVL